MKIICRNGNTIDYWYDRRIRQSVVQVLDSSGNQIGDAEYSGNRKSAKFSRELAIKDNGGRV